MIRVHTPGGLKVGEKKKKLKALEMAKRHKGMKQFRNTKYSPSCASSIYVFIPLVYIASNLDFAEYETPTEHEDWTGLRTVN